MATVSRRPGGRNRRPGRKTVADILPLPAAALGTPLDMSALASSPAATAAAAALNNEIARRVLRETGAADLDGAFSPPVQPVPGDGLGCLSRAALVAALARELPKGAAGARPSPGDYTFRGTVTVRLDCTVSQAVGVEAAPTWKPDYVAALAATLSAARVKADRVAKLVEAALTDGVADLVDEDYLSLVAAAADRAKARWQAGQPLESRAGALKVAGAVDLVAFKPE